MPIFPFLRQGCAQLLRHDCLSDWTGTERIKQRTPLRAALGCGDFVLSPSIPAFAAA